MSSPILETDIDVQFLQFREHRPVIERTKEIVGQKDVVSPNLERDQGCQKRQASQEVLVSSMP
jgi:hypothetical protein